MTRLMLEHAQREVSLPRGGLTLGIKVANTPGIVAGATADLGSFLLLGALRNFNPGILALRRG